MQVVYPPPSNSATTADYRAKYQHLKKYHEQLDHYRHLLQERSPRRISHVQIPEFVAQHLLGDADRPLHNYLAVREVQIYCTFPHDAVEQVAVIDMPGLGDTGVGDETRMIQALGELVDLVLYVRMPKATGDHWADVDVQLYDTAARALPEIPMEQRAFMVLNRLTDGSNAANCRDLQGSLQQHHLRVARAVTANCADPEQVNAHILQPLLEYMAEQVQLLDMQYLRGQQGSLERWQQRVQDWLNQLTGGGSSKANRLFGELFERFWRSLTKQLEELRKVLESQREAPNTALEGALKQALGKARQMAMPQAEDISQLKLELGGVQEAHLQYLRELRTTLTGYFADLDNRPLA